MSRRFLISSVRATPLDSLSLLADSDDLGFAESGRVEESGRDESCSFSCLFSLMGSISFKGSRYLVALGLGSCFLTRGTGDDEDLRADRLSSFSFPRARRGESPLRPLRGPEYFSYASFR